MTDTELIVAALDRVAEHVKEQTAQAASLAEEVRAETSERQRKVTWLQRSVFGLIGATVLLLVMAFTNFAILNSTRSAASAAQETNALLLSCFDSKSECAKLSAEAEARRLDEVRATQYVIAFCQRQNPAADDASGAKVLACIREYYPDLDLPPKKQGAPK